MGLFLQRTRGVGSIVLLMLTWEQRTLKALFLFKKVIG